MPQATPCTLALRIQLPNILLLAVCIVNLVTTARPPSNLGVKLG
ncbi:hypothetical protein BFJ67_g12017 [Fusarium oxysporum f. sp. cepae]|nr:hypothetical protein BFJ67_g12017 [Fusarium oxysporum f. sp. cepae]